MGVWESIYWLGDSEKHKLHYRLLAQPQMSINISLRGSCTFSYFLVLPQILGVAVGGACWNLIWRIIVIILVYKKVKLFLNWFYLLSWSLRKLLIRPVVQIFSSDLVNSHNLSGVIINFMNLEMPPIKSQVKNILKKEKKNLVVEWN